MKRAPVTGEDLYRVNTAARRLFPRVLPGTWRETPIAVEYQRLWDVSGSGLRIIAETEIIDDKLWAHVSVSGRGRLPTWEELRDIKTVLLGSQARAIQVLPPESEYVNLHGYTLHLFMPIDHEPIPDFRREVSPGKFLI